MGTPLPPSDGGRPLHRARGRMLPVSELLFLTFDPLNSSTVLIIQTAAGVKRVPAGSVSPERSVLLPAASHLSPPLASPVQVVASCSCRTSAVFSARSGWKGSSRGNHVCNPIVMETREEELINSPGSE